MRTGAAVVLSALVAAAATLGGTLALDATRTPAPAPAPPPAAPATGADLPRRVERLEARLDEIASGIDALRAEAAAAREEARRREAAAKEEAERRAKSAEGVVAAGLGGVPPEGERKPDGFDEIAKAASKEIRRGLQQQFRKISDLVTNPTPEALDARQREIKYFAGAIGAAAGLDRAQVATLERIFNETDERARQDLRPILQGVDDYRRIDYARVRKLTDDSFTAQNDQFDREFPKEKAESVKTQLEPVRNMFGAMIDALEKEAKSFQESGGAPK
jgi:hypothetical protein